MKKILALIITLMMTFSLFACGGVDCDESNEGNSDTTVDSQTESEESSETTMDSQPVGGVTESQFDFKKLGTYGMPEPSFTYSYQYYVETMQGMGDDGEPILRPKFVFTINTDRVGAHEYMSQVQSAGWSGDVPELRQEEDGAFWYISENDSYKINITWDDDTDSGEIFIIDKTNICVWEGEQRIYVIDGITDADSYGPYGSAQ